MTNKLSTGILGLDKLFYGGIQLHNSNNDGTVIVITGERGVYKTNFAIQLTHGLLKSLQRQQITTTDSKTKFYSLNKDRKELEQSYYNMLITKRIEEFIIEVISNPTKINQQGDDPFICNIISKIEYKLSNKGIIRNKADIIKLLSERTVHYNVRTCAFHIKRSDEEGDNDDNMLCTSMNNDELKELLSNDEANWVEFDDCDSEDNGELKTYKYANNSTSKFQQIIDDFALKNYTEKRPCIVIEGMSDISDNNLGMLPFSHIEHTLRKASTISILVFDERYKNIKCNADIVIEMRSNEANLEGYTHHELKISKSVFQVVTLGWHQYKCRDSGIIEVFPSLHRILQKRNHISQIALTTHNSILNESYGQFLNRPNFKLSNDDHTNYTNYNDNKELIQTKLLNDIFQNSSLRDSNSSNYIQNNWLAEVLFGKDHFVQSSERWHVHTYATAIIGNPHTYKRTLLNAMMFSSACKQEHTLALLFDKDLNTACKQLVCPGNKNSTSDQCKCCYSYIHSFPIRMGCISAEELFAVLEEQINIKFPEGQSIKHIVIDDLQKIDYSFPLIKSNSLFLSALITFCREKNIKLTVLCDKKTSLVQELCSLTDNVISTNREKSDINQVTFYIEKNVYASSNSIIKQCDILNMSQLFKCEQGIISITEDTSVYNENEIGSMKEYWRKGENVYIAERSDNKYQK